MEIICRKKTKGIGSQQIVNGIYDTFKAHTTDEMKAVLPINRTNLIMVPPGCTSKCQPLDVCTSKPFKGVLRNCWEDYIADIVTNYWVAEGFYYLQSYPEMIEKSFFVYRITTHNPQKVRNDKFLRSIMQNVNEKIREEEEEGLLEECDEDHSTRCNLVVCVLFSRTSVMII